MSNVVKFPKSNVRQQNAPAAARGQPAEPLKPRKRSVIRVLTASIRVTLFLFLYWLRMPLVLIAQLLTLPMFVLALFAWYAFPEKPQMYGSFGAVSFITFVVMYGYDFMLTWLSPRRVTHIL